MFVSVLKFRARTFPLMRSNVHFRFITMSSAIMQNDPVAYDLRMRDDGKQGPGQLKIKN